MWLTAAVQIAIVPCSSLSTGATDLCLHSGDLLLKHICKVALALDCEDQCKGGHPHGHDGEIPGMQHYKNILSV